MANPEHLSILKQGVEVWNKWREENPDINVDLIAINASEWDLRSYDLNKALLFKSNFWGSDLRDADFRGANLTGAIFRKANLDCSNFEPIFSLKEIRTKANEAKFSGASLKNSKLYKANLADADFRGAVLCEADFHRSNLHSADLRATDLCRCNLRKAYLKRAILSKANLTEAILTGADLREANLNEAKFKKAVITGANLYGTAREGWELEQIFCDYIFWDTDWKTRIPNKRDFSSNEFESLYKSLPMIQFYFEDGFTPIGAVLMDRVVQGINEKHPEFELKLDSFHSRGQPHAVFTVLHKEVAEAALNQIKAGYEARISKLEGEREALERCFNRALEEPRTIIKRIEMGDTYEIKGQSGAVGRGASAHDINFIQVWNDIAKDVDLPRLSEELSTLKGVVSREAKSSDQIRALAEVSDAETAAKAGNGSKVVEHLKKAGKWTFDVATNIGTDVAAEVIKKSMGL